MRHVSLFVILIISFIGTACDSETVDNAADFKFQAVDKEKNIFNLVGTIRYRLKNKLEVILKSKYGRQLYKDSLLVPVISSISKKVLSDYSAVEIYNYKRDEIVQKLNEQTKTAFAEFKIEVTNVFIWSVELPDTLEQKIEKEHVKRFQNAFNNCSREIKGVVTEVKHWTNGDYITYEFKIGDKKYTGYASSTEFRDKLGVGDSLAIEYACEDAILNRVKK